jgi:V/A-type H+-transporting ATPase subunit E
MELQLQELLDRIKREGVDAARTDAEKIAAEAQARAAARLEEAERQAEATVAKARQDAARAEEAGKAALEQASRNLLLAFRDSVQALLAAIVKMDVGASYGPEVLAQIIPTVVNALASGGAEDLAVLLPPETLKKLQDRYAKALVQELRKGVDLKPSTQIQGGFRVTEKAGAAYYDFSATAVAELLSRHLNARLGEILKSAAQGL